MQVAARLEELSSLLDELFRSGAARLPGGVEAHRVRFSRQITTSWAIIYYRRKEIRLSPYVFLLPEKKLHHGSDWRELAATVLHEVAHAHLWAETKDKGHPPAFRDRLQRLGIKPNGGCDLGPENIAYRFRYVCPECKRSFPRHRRLSKGIRCARCYPGGVLTLAESLVDPWERLAEQTARIDAAIEEGKRARLVDPIVTTARSAVR